MMKGYRRSTKLAKNIQVGTIVGVYDDELVVTQAIPSELGITFTYSDGEVVTKPLWAPMRAYKKL